MFTCYKPNKVLTPEQQYCLMTDIFYDMDINLDKKICLVADINPDGIGDLMLQIRAFHILNKRYPGGIQCISFAAKQHVEKYKLIAKNHDFQTIFYDLANSRTWIHSLLSEQEFELVIQISYALPSQPFLNRNIRHYTLSEIKHHHPFNSRDKMGYLGFMPDGEGLFLEAISDNKHLSSVLMTLPESLTKVLSVPDNLTEDKATNWYRMTWIAQSCYYDMNPFIVTLVAQLYYIRESCPLIKNVIIKFNSKTREGKNWDVVDKFQSAQFKSVLNECNIKVLVIDNLIVFKNDSNAITLKLSTQYLTHTDYQAFVQLLNGCCFPSGDNTYCEAWSNSNTTLPPFPELRSYKQSSLNPLISAIDLLDLDENSRIFLHDHIMSCLYMHTQVKDNTDESTLFDISRRMASVWSRARNPHAAWLVLAHYLSKQNLNDRLISIIKEQLIFARHPELISQKYKSIDSEGKHGIDHYKAIVLRKLSAKQIAPQNSVKV